VSKEKAAIEAAIALPWSNRQTEGQVSKLKLVKRVQRSATEPPSAD
jgi:transposase